jgi:methionyl-tRNA formyltransferase
MGHDEGVAGLRVVYFGMHGRFSGPPFLRLYKAGMDVNALVVPALPGGAPVAAPSPGYQPRGPMLPMAGGPVPHNVWELAQGAGITVYEVERFDDDTLSTLAGLKPDVIAVACFPWRLPPALLKLPRLGCLNVHPSLLPENRGPDPLFWTFRHGDPQTGVTIHVMEGGLDTGPLVLQQPVAVREGISEAELEVELSTVGADLLVEAIRGLQAGTIKPQPQDGARATNYGFPSPDDFAITPDRPARWAYNFARGVGGREEAVVVVVEGLVFPVSQTLGYDEHATLDVPYAIEEDVLRLRCSPGLFTARLFMPRI